MILVIGNKEGITRIEDNMSVAEVEYIAQFDAVASGGVLGKVSNNITITMEIILLFFKQKNRCYHIQIKFIHVRL